MMVSDKGGADGEGESIKTMPFTSTLREVRIRAISKATTPPNDQPTEECAPSANTPHGFQRRNAPPSIKGASLACCSIVCAYA